MKKLRIRIDQFVEKAELQWKDVSVKKQRLLTKLFFIGYSMLTLIVIIHIWSKAKDKSDMLAIDHISNIPREIKIKSEAVKNPAGSFSKNDSHERSK